MLTRFVKELYEHEEIPFDEQTCAANLGKLIDQPNLGRVFLIAAGHHHVGYAVVVHFFSLELGGNSAMLDEFFVEEQYRGGGIGSCALNELLRRVRQEGFKAIQLEVAHDNHAAKSLYLRKGFAVRHRHLMVCSLNRPGQRLRVG